MGAASNHERAVAHHDVALPLVWERTAVPEALPPHLRSPRFWLKASGSLLFRLGCYAVMVWLALWAEARAAPTLPDVVLEQVPYLPQVDRYNYVVWTVGYLPVALWLFAFEGERFIRYSVSAGVVALIRGICIALTGLGPVNGVDGHAGMSAAERADVFWQVMSPAFFAPDGQARLSLTKDLFFSGHTSTTALLLLYVWPWPKARGVMLTAHVLVVASVFLAHLHYSIDVIGAWAITFCVFAFREWNVGQLLRSTAQMGRGP